MALLIAAGSYVTPNGERFEINPAALSLTASSSASNVQHYQTTFYTQDTVQEREIAAPSPELEAMLKAVAADMRADDKTRETLRQQLLAGVSFNLHTDSST